VSNIVVDCRGESCPIPLIETRKALRKAAAGEMVEVLGTHQASKREIPIAVKNLGSEVVEVQDEIADGAWRIIIRK
jgi:tRNA 2-thiouridine synthesizing protein A